MAESLVRAGVPVVVNDLDATAVVQLTAQGARSADTLASLVTQARIVGVCVPADHYVRAVLGGPDGLLAHLASGSVVAIHSTVLPETVILAHVEAAQYGVAVVEAAVTGAAAAASVGKSTFLLGGDQTTIEQLIPLLDARERPARSDGRELPHAPLPSRPVNV